MKFSCSAQELLTGLSDAARALTTRPPMPLLDNLKLSAKDGGVTITGTDGILTISARIRADVLDTGEALLPGRLLTEFVRKMPEGKATLNACEKTGAALTCGTSRLTLACLPTDGYPKQLETDKAHVLRVPQRRLKDMISRVVFAIAQHESRQTLTGCLLEASKNELRLVGIDGFRMAILRAGGAYKLPEGTDTIKAIVPRHAIIEICRLIPDDENGEVALVLGHGQMAAAIGNATVTVTLIGGEYISYRQILPQQSYTRITLKSRELEQAIERATLIARHGKNSLITFATEDKLLRVSAVSDVGDTQEEVAIHLQGEPIEIAFNARYIGEAVKNVTDECCTLFCTNSVSPCVISSGKDIGDYTFLVLPVRKQD